MAEKISLLANNHDDKNKKAEVLLEELWEAELKQYGEKDASLMRVLLKQEKRSLVAIVVLTHLATLFGFLTASFCTKFLLQFADGKEQDKEFGFGACASFIVTLCLSVLFEEYSKTLSIMLGLRLATATRGLLFRKLTRLKYVTDTNTGKIVNIFMGETEQLVLIRLVLFIISLPFMVLVFTSYAAFTLQPAALLGLFTLPIGICGMLLLGKVHVFLRRRSAVASDARIQLLHGILSNIKIVKMFAWEPFFMTSVKKARDVEMKPIWHSNVLATLSRYVSVVMEVALLVSCVAAVLVSSGTLQSVEVFNIFAVVGLMGFSFASLPTALTSLADNLVACQRIKSVLIMEEYKFPKNFEHITTISDDKDASKTKMHDSLFINEKELTTLKTGFPFYQMAENFDQKRNNKNADVIEFKMATFAHQGTEKSKAAKSGTVSSEVDTTQCLQNINLSITKGTLVGVCGQVGAGKSSLFQAIIGRMSLLSGDFRVQGRTAIVPQESWIINDTLRNNILFDEPCNVSRYRHVLDICCLEEDIRALHAGDDTEIGERGTTLSGGQKQRVSLARAVYSDADVYLLDDPLSAVDARVGEDIFTRCILGDLRGKTVLLASHNYQYLSRCDRVLFLDQEIINSTHEDLVKVNAHYRKLLLNDTEEVEDGEDPIVSEDAPDIRDKEQRKTDFSGTNSGQLIKAESDQYGAPLWRAMLSYIRAAGGILAFLLIVVMVGLGTAAQYSAIWWLDYWFQSNSAKPNCTVDCEQIVLTDSPVFRFRFVFLACLPLIAIILVLAEGVAIAMVANRASRTIHGDLLSRAMAGSVTFFLATPIGRLQNCFSALMSSVDRFGCMILQLLVAWVIQAVVVMAAVGANFPYMVIYFVACAWPLWYVVKRLTMGMTRFMRLETIQKSLIFSAITSTVQGLPTIALAGKQEVWQKKLFLLQDRAYMTTASHGLTQQWSSVRIGAMTSLLASLVAILVVALPSDHMASEAGVALSFSLQFGRYFSRLLRFSALITTILTGVERLFHFSENIQTERQTSMDAASVPASWPCLGRLEFKNVCLRYRPDHPLALDHATLEVKPGEKIGVVGRTGAGKSSLMAVLLRLVEKDSGSILIDGVDVSKVSLRRLRSSVAVIPQEPLLFSGTIRSNIDPFDKLSDEDIWDLLERCYLKDRVSNLPSGLEHAVDGGGANLSVGERQLLCLARAISRKAKIVVLDEATSSVDPLTDSRMQETVAAAFSGCSLLVIAHRLHTILSCDRILVLHHGKVAEYDTVPKLLAYDSLFSRLLKAAEDSARRSGVRHRDVTRSSE